MSETVVKAATGGTAGALAPYLLIAGVIVGGLYLFKDKISDLIGGGVQGATSALGGAAQAAGNTWDGITSYASGGADALGGVAGNIWDGLGEGYDAAGDIAENAYNAVGGAYEWMANAFNGIFGGNTSNLNGSGDESLNDVLSQGSGTRISLLEALGVTQSAGSSLYLQTQKTATNDDTVRSLMSQGLSTAEIRSMGYDTINVISRGAEYIATYEVPAYVRAMTGIEKDGVLELWKDAGEEVAYLKVGDVYIHPESMQYQSGMNYEQLMNKVKLSNELLTNPDSQNTGGLIYERYKEVYEASTGNEISKSKAFFEGTKYETSTVEAFIQAAGEGDASAANWLQHYAPTAADNVVAYKAQKAQEAYDKLQEAIRLGQYTGVKHYQNVQNAIRSIRSGSGTIRDASIISTPSGMKEYFKALGGTHFTVTKG